VLRIQDASHALIPEQPEAVSHGIIKFMQSILAIANNKK
jgi:hypothetical protein